MTLAPFSARPPWLGGDLQTLRNALRGPAAAPPAGGAQVLVFDAANGRDRLSGLLDRPRQDRGKPLAILVHGLTGEAEGALSLTSAAHLLDHGWRTLRLTLRGAAANAPFSTTTYHSGLSADLGAVLDQLSPDMKRDGVVMIGFSAGGNQILKLLGERGERGLVRAAVSICAPISLIDAVHRLMAPRNVIYHRHLLRGLKRDVLQCQLDATLVDAAGRARSLFSYDELVTAPMHGFKGAMDFYVQSGALGYLNRIQTPTLVLAARDDPWIPVSTYEAVDWKACPAITLVISPGGGHCGFHDRASRIPWHDRIALDFIEQATSG